MMMPLEILMLPLYKLIVDMRIINTYAGVILPFVVSPIAIFFFRQYEAEFPKISWMRDGSTGARNSAFSSGS